MVICHCVSVSLSKMTFFHIMFPHLMFVHIDISHRVPRSFHLRRLSAGFIMRIARSFSFGVSRDTSMIIILLGVSEHLRHSYTHSELYASWNLACRDTSLYYVGLNSLRLLSKVFAVMGRGSGKGRCGANGGSGRQHYSNGSSSASDLFKSLAQRAKDVQDEVHTICNLITGCDPTAGGPALNPAQIFPHSSSHEWLYPHSTSHNVAQRQMLLPPFLQTSPPVHGHMHLLHPPAPPTKLLLRLLPIFLSSLFPPSLSLLPCSLLLFLRSLLHLLPFILPPVLQICHRLMQLSHTFCTRPLTVLSLRTRRMLELFCGECDSLPSKQLLLMASMARTTSSTK